MDRPPPRTPGRTLGAWITLVLGVVIAAIALYPLLIVVLADLFTSATPLRSPSVGLSMLVLGIAALYGVSLVALALKALLRPHRRAALWTAVATIPGVGLGVWIAVRHDVRLGAALVTAFLVADAFLLRSAFASRGGDSGEVGLEAGA